MDPKQTRPKRQDKTLTTTVNLWYRLDSESIAISFKEFGLISTVSEKQEANAATSTCTTICATC